MNSAAVWTATAVTIRCRASPCLDQFLTLAFRPTELPRELARYRGLSPCDAAATLPHGASAARSRATLWRMPTKTVTGASMLTWPRSSFGKRAFSTPKTSSVWSWNRLSTLLDSTTIDLLSVLVPVGSLDAQQGRCEIAYVAGSARQYSYSYPPRDHRRPCER